MFKITGLDKLERELSEAQQALDELNGKLGTVSFDPHDPSSIEAAIQLASQMVDHRVAQYEANPFIDPLIEQMKEMYREKVLQKAAEARIKADEDK